MMPHNSDPSKTLYNLYYPPFILVMCILEMGFGDDIGIDRTRTGIFLLETCELLQHLHPSQNRLGLYPAIAYVRSGYDSKKRNLTYGSGFHVNICNIDGP